MSERTVTFEEACDLSTRIMTAENLRTLGPEEASRVCREVLQAVGWTIGELCDESALRMKGRIRLMEEADAKGKDRDNS